MSVHNNCEMKIPVLLYHRLYKNAKSNNRQYRSPYYIAADQFQAQMNYLLKSGYRAITLQELLQISGDHDIHEFTDRNRLLVITFDDGYIDNYSYAYPILRKCKFTGTFFVIVDRIGSPDYLSWNQLEEMQDQGMEIQSHGLTHRPFEILPTFSIEQELCISKKILEKNLNSVVTFISYPHGSYDHRVLRIAENSGYVGSCTSEMGYFDPAVNPFKIPRITIRGSYNALDFERIIRSDRMFLAKLKLAKLLKNKMKNILGIENYQMIYEKLYNEVSTERFDIQN